MFRVRSVRSLVIAALLSVYWIKLPAATADGAIPAPQAQVPAQPGEVPEMSVRAAPCLTCHGQQGREGVDGYYPRINAKPAIYLFNQLRHFRDGRRQYAGMNHLLTGLDDQYLLALARYFENQSLEFTPGAGARRPSSDPPGVVFQHQRGDVDLPACSNCHGDNLMGDGRAVPPLLGLPRDYINAQLGAWRNGSREAAKPDCMAEVSRQLTPGQISRTSQWLAAQPVPTGHGQTALGINPDILSRCGSVTQATSLVARNRTRQTSDRARAARATEQTSRGAYLARIANCTGCHSAPGKPPMAGGVAVSTPFGTVWSSNLTPDPETGLGRWTADEFWQAMHHGRSRDGSALYPAFPYPSFTSMTRGDSDAIFQWLQRLQPVKQQTREPALRFPFNTRLALWVWRWLYFRPGQVVTDPTGLPGTVPIASRAKWERGAYLVNALGHCGACHSKRNLLGAGDGPHEFHGETMPDGQWYSPSLHQPDDGGLQNESVEQVMQLLRTGQAGKRATTGPMSRIVQQSLQYLTDRDASAMARYLQSLTSTPDDKARTSINQAGNTAGRSTGQSIYEKHCKDCHGADGMGDTGANDDHAYSKTIPVLSGNPAVLNVNPLNLVSVTLHGGYQPVTDRHRWPFGMPPYYQTLSPQEIAQVLTYIRQAFGNQAAAVSVRDVQQRR